MKVQLIRFREAVKIGGYEEVYATSRPDVRGIPKHEIDVDQDARMVSIRSVSKQDEVLVPFENVLYVIKTDEKKKAGTEASGSSTAEGANQSVNNVEGSKKLPVSEAASVR